ncbi:MAG: DUF6531 domain-containing protein [Propionibacteriaceae bacterium]|nr:DUF6531 domain-containing protein [Propionibacteriaceae bacterium]
MTDLGAYAEDVRFNHEAATTLATACRNAASTLDQQAGSRASLVTAALTEFRGYFAELFTDNADIERSDRGEVAQALRAVATAVEALAREATSEQERRQAARAWKQRRDERNALDHIHDFFMGEEEPPRGPAPQPVENPSQPVTRPRQSPSPGSGGVAGLTSADPADLRSFATGSAGLNDAIRSLPGQLRNWCSAFVDGCGWGTLNADAVWVGFTKYIEANDLDVTWANTVASAFEAAGGQGLSTLPDVALMAALATLGVAASRADLTIEMPQVLGAPPTTGYVNDPVNSATGNFIEPEVDLGFAGGCGSLQFSRMYNSVSPLVGAFGTGWSSWAESGLVVTDEQASWVRPDGRHTIFPRLGDGWERALGESFWLARDEDGLVVSDNAAGRWVFTAGGRLESVSRGAGTKVDLLYEQDRLIGLVHERGRSIEVVWSGERVSALVASDGRRVDYLYDQLGRLIEAVRPVGRREYRWGKTGLVEAVVDADGVVEVVNTYDEAGRVTEQQSPFGRTTRFTYLPGRATVVAEADGVRANTWLADGSGRLTAVVDAAGRRQSMVYDRWGNQVQVTDRNGQTTLRRFNDRGLICRQVSPSGADIQWGYDEFDRVTTVMAASGGATLLEYQADERNPSLMVDATGGRTQFEWTDGLLTGVVDPTGVRVEFGYDAHGDLVTTTDADGNVARLVRDEAGRVTAAVTPLGYRTEFRYGPEGLLASKRDPAGATWRFEYTAAGRLAATVDPLGARTVVEYGAHGEETATTDPLGRVVRRQFDDLGNLAQVTLPDGSAWQYTHDALSRLVAATDPAGGQWTNEYDAGGALAARTDPTGVRQQASVNPASRSGEVDDGLMSVGLTFDQLGRPVKTTGPDGSQTMTIYDLCGRPVEVLGPEGELTVLRRDAAGRLIERVAPGGVSTRFEYDRCGRVRAVTDPASGRTEREYDADGRLIRQILPSGDTATATWDEVGRLLSLRQPGRGVASYRWDKNGRLTSVHDSRWGRRRFSYDLAGQLVAVTNGLGGVTRYDYDELGRCLTITDPAGGVTRREWNRLNKLVAETDPLGRVTRAGYDAAGRQLWQEDPAGRRLQWTFDASGRQHETLVDGRLMASIERRLAERTVVITDHSGPTPVWLERQWDRAGRLIRQSRDGQTVAWEYDQAGHRQSMTSPDGTRTTYTWDPAGRLEAIDHPLFGLASFGYDQAGRLVEAASGAAVQTWDWDRGWISGHTVTDATGAYRTVIGRDDSGRISQIDRDGQTTDYQYDQANQLIAATGEGRAATWEWDPAGRLIRETNGDQTIDYDYDPAGQLTEARRSDGQITRHRYDPAGRRLQTTNNQGLTRDYAWSPTGWLSQITDTSPERTTEIPLHVDATGVLSQVGDTDLWWDSANPIPSPLQIGSLPLLAAGPVTGAGDQWHAPGWRSARSEGLDPRAMDARSLGPKDGPSSVRSEASDPWVVGASSLGPSNSAPPASSGAPDSWAMSADSIGSGTAAQSAWSGAPDPWEMATKYQVGPVGVSTSGTITIDGLEWLGARVMDPASRGFLTTDPLEPITGAGWAANPYSYAGNDPLNLIDPTGLRPVTDAELDQYAAEHGGAFKAIGDWATEGWGAWLVNGAMVLAGGVLIATGVGGPAGMMLISAGADGLIQKATTGTVDYGQVLVSGLVGAIPGGGFVARGGATFGRVMLDGMVAGGVGGFAQGIYSYATSPGPHTLETFATTVGTSTAMGVGFGGAGSAAGYGLVHGAQRLLGDVVPAPQTNYINSARVLERSAQEPGPMHNFPAMFDEHILQQGERTVTPNYYNQAKPNLSSTSVLYTLPGDINGRAGTYEIGTRVSTSGRTEVIMHRFFRPGET